MEFTKKQLDEINKISNKKDQIIKVISIEASTTDEIEVITGISHQTASSAITELAAGKVIEPTGDERKTRSGAFANVWGKGPNFAVGFDESRPKKPDPTVGDHGKRKHAKNSPSQLASKEICPHYQGVKTSQADLHPITLSGTRCHEAFETNDDSHLDDVEVTLTNYCRAYRDHILGNLYNWEMQYEAHLKTHEKSCSGFGDLLAISNDGAVGHYFDPKFGYNQQQDAEVNPQGQAYVLGAFISRPSLQDVTVHFIYPRWHTVSVHKYTRQDMDRIKLRISTIVDRVKVADAQRRAERKGSVSLKQVERNPCLSNCLYCANKFDCPAMLETALQISTREPELPNEFDPGSIVGEVNMGKALRIANWMEAWCKNVKAFAMTNFNEKGEIPEGFEPKTRKGRGKVINTRAVLQKAREYGVPDHEIEDTLTASVPKLAELCKDHAPHGQKTKTDKEFREVVAKNNWFDPGSEITYLAEVKPSSK